LEGWRFGTGNERGSARGGLDNGGQFNDKCGALARLALDSDSPSMFLDDPVTETEAEPGAFANLFSGKEGIKNLRKVLWRDARTIVVKEDANALFAFLSRDLNRAVGLVGFNSLAGVTENVQEYLLYLMRVAEHSRKGWIKLRDH